MHIDVLNTESIFIISLTSGVVINRLVLTVFDVYQEMDIICLQTNSRRFFKIRNTATRRGLKISMYTLSALQV